MFDGIPTTKVYVDTLTDEQKTCGVCGTKMVPIGHEVIRTEIKYTEPKLKAYISVTAENKVTAEEVEKQIMAGLEKRL